ncbi:MAG: hypothetical protein AAFV53_42085, partial [Myxococcota bacterium]
RPLPRPVLDDSAPEWWLLERDAQGEIGLGGGSMGLCGVLAAAARPVSWDTLQSRAEALGADPDESDALLEGLVAEGLLIRASQSNGFQRRPTDAVDPTVF